MGVCYNKQGEEGPKAWIRGPGISKQGESEIEKCNPLYINLSSQNFTTAREKGTNSIEFSAVRMLRGGTRVMEQLFGFAGLGCGCNMLACPLQVEKWRAMREAGFTPGSGRITGCCNHSP
ncbi:hypothetical protein HKD37_15G043749 [Glycine soja]